MGLSAETFGDRLSKFGGFAPGYDYMRLGLALAIFNVHAGSIFNGSDAGKIIIAATANDGHVTHWGNWREPIYLCLVPMFFALSGFLVTASAFRTKDIRTFLAFRILRIVPALAVEVSLSAILLGGFFTTLNPGAYYTSAGFFRYFGNIAGFVAFYLPGVFLESKIPGIINNSLWTLPAEFFCYALAVALMATKVIYDRKIFSILFAILTLLLFISSLFFDYSPQHSNQPVWLVVYYFFVGVLLFHWRDTIILSPILVVLFGLLSFGMIYGRLPLIFAPLFLSYVVIGAGLFQVPKFSLLTRNDISYGIYLYGFPISQAIAAMALTSSMPSRVLRAIALAVTILFATSSWRLIERHALAQKKRFIKR